MDQEQKQEYRRKQKEWAEKVLSGAKALDAEGKFTKSRGIGIGGSDAGTLMGVNPWSNVYRLWLDKTQGKHFEGNEKTDWGHRLEPLVADRFQEAVAERGLTVTVDKTHYQSKEDPWLVGNIDRMLMNGDTPAAILEIKTAGRDDGWDINTAAYSDDEWHLTDYDGLLRRPEQESVPQSYWYQCQQYMYVTGVHDCYLAALLHGQRFAVWHIPYSEEAVTSLRLTAEDFWCRHVLDGIPIEPDFEYWESQKPEESTVPATPDLYALCREYNDASAAESAAKARKEAAKRALGLAIRDASAIRDEALKKNLCTWKSQERRSFSLNLLLEAHPELKAEVNDYYTVTTSRVMRVSKIKE